jgi:hypothetical protein
VIMGLSRWYFNALAFSLTKEVTTPPAIPDALETRGNEYLTAAHTLKKSSDKLRSKALYADAQPRAWVTVGMRTPQDRDKEAQFTEQLKAWHKEVEEQRVRKQERKKERER